MEDEYKDWTKYHITTNMRNGWRFFKVGAKRAIASGTKNYVMQKALYYLEWNGGYCVVHNKDASVDFIINNWCG